MTTASLQIEASTGKPIAWGQWCSIDEAAPKLGKSASQLRRRCAASLHGRGLAAYLVPRTGGKPRWFIKRDYSLTLAPGAVGRRQQAPNLAGYTKKQIQTAWLRVACVAALCEARQTWRGLIRDWLPTLIAKLRAEHDGLRISRTSLLRWDTLYIDRADVVKLIDGRGGDTRTRGDRHAWSAFADFYLDDRQPTMMTCWKRAKDLAREHDWHWCSYSSCKRQLNDRIPPERQMYHRQPAKWRSQLQPTIAQDPEAWAAGQCWIGDHKQLDVRCLHGGHGGGGGGKIIRPWLTVWKDWRTRRTTGWVLSALPNSSTILAALRVGLLDEANFGGPAVVWIDNGKDFDCYSFHGQTKTERLSKLNVAIEEPQAVGIFNLLDVKAHFSLAYNPNGKARLESWFGAPLAEFCKSFPTYTGPNTEHKPESLAKILAKPRLIPSFEHVRDRLADFIAGDNRRVNHSMPDLVDDDRTPLSPDQAMAKWCTTRRVMADPEVLDLLLQTWHKPVTATRHGIVINVAGMNVAYGGDDPALMPFKAPRKKDRPPLNVSYDPADLATIRVYDDQWRFICTAAMNGMGGLHGGDKISRQKLAELQRRKAQYRKSLKHQRQNHEIEYLTDAELLALASDAPDDDNSLKAAPQERTFRLVQTPIDGQLNAVRSERTRMAAGAEDFDIDGLPEIDLSNIPLRANDDDLPLEQTTGDLIVDRDVVERFGKDALETDNTPGNESDDSLPHVLDMMQ